MYIGIYDAIRGCRIQELRLKTIANNLANTGTGGFKRDITSFDKALRVHMKTDFNQGNVRRTDNRLDLALEGEGFFKVKTPAGIRYTRNGRFCLNAEGRLVTQNGDPVLGAGGPITIRGEHVAIDAAGQIEVDGAAVDTLSMASFERPELLQKEGLSYYVYNGDEKEILRPKEISVRDGFLEESNVVIAEEVIRMVETLRIFESYQKVLQSFDESDAKAINQVGRL
ncbi:MAG: flagellar hook-basal body protein [Desulfobacterales bacterium]|nr:flagellar hook-basal body protein [Desulfobacterales bacterium]